MLSAVRSHGDDPWLIQAYGMMLGLSSQDMTVLRGAFGDPVAIRHAEVLSEGQLILAVLEYADDVRCVWEIGNIPQATRTWFDEELTVYGSAQTVSIQFHNPYVRYAPAYVRVQEMDGTAHTSNTIATSFDEAFRREWQHFHHCVTTGAAPRTGAADGLRDIEILRARKKPPAVVGHCLFVCRRYPDCHSAGAATCRARSNLHCLA
jgi:predicted dehydrogenase